MSRYIALPTLNVDFCAPSRMSFDTPAGGLAGGRNGLGQSISINVNGGPHVVGSYEQCKAYRPEQHEYLNMVAARLNGGYRFINVPVNSDFMGPFDGRSPFITGITHSDGSPFSDGAGYSQARAFAMFAEPAALNAGRIVINVFGAERKLRWSDWMSTYHDDKGWRMWRYWDASDPEPVTQTIGGVPYTGSRYILSIDVPLREAVSAGQRIELARPRCVMKFADGFSLSYEIDAPFTWLPTLKFVEAW